MPLGADVGLGTGHIVLDGDPATSTERGTADPHFSVPVYCVQIARCIRMPLGTEVGLGPGDIVLDGDPAPPPAERSTAAASFWPTLLWFSTRLHRQFSKLLVGTRGSVAVENVPRIAVQLLIVDSAMHVGRLSWQSYRIIATRLFFL